jgi:hypothetical protein
MNNGGGSHRFLERSRQSRLESSFVGGFTAERLPTATFRPACIMKPFQVFKVSITALSVGLPGHLKSCVTSLA